MVLRRADRKASARVNEPEDDHYCSKTHEAKKKACDLCLMQRRRMREERLLKQGKPTLVHRPFAALLGK